MGPGSSSPLRTISMGTADTNSTGAEADSTPAGRADPQTQGSILSGNISDLISNSGLVDPDDIMRPEPPNPAPPSTSHSPSAPAAVSSPPAASPSGPASLLTSQAGSPASHAVKPILLSSNASSPAAPLLSNDTKPHMLYDPSTSIHHAVHALSPSGSTALPSQAASPQSAYADQGNISASHGSNTMRPSLDQKHSMGVATASFPQDKHPDNPALAPAPAVKGPPSGLPPAALSSQTGAAGQMSAAQGQGHAAPQHMTADSAQAMGPDSAAPLPGTAPAPAPASSRSAVAPEDAQAVHEKTGSDSLPVIVLGALLGVAIAALLAGKSLLHCVMFCIIDSRTLLCACAQW